MRGASVRLNSTNGAHETEHARVLSDGVAPDWESVRIFLEVARGGSFRTAATKLGMTGHGIAKRIEQLEHQLGAMLFTRHRDGVRRQHRARRRDVLLARTARAASDPGGLEIEIGDQDPAAMSGSEIEQRRALNGVVPDFHGPAVFEHEQSGW